jgi:hypothetical protein
MADVKVPSFMGGRSGANDPGWVQAFSADHRHRNPLHRVTNDVPVPTFIPSS